MPAAKARTSPTTSAGTLYLWGMSPFGYKVTMAAAHKGVPVELRIASLPDMLEAKKHTGKRKVPFVVAADGRWITDSTSICAWLEEKGGPASLLPQGEKERAECLLLEDWADEALNASAEPWLWMGGNRFSTIHRFNVEEQSHGLSRFAFKVLRRHMTKLWTGRVNKHGGVEGARKLWCAQMDLVERRLAGKPWLFDDGPTVADFAIAGQLANCFRFHCSEDLVARPALASMVRRAAALLPWGSEQ